MSKAWSFVIPATGSWKKRLIKSSLNSSNFSTARLQRPDPSLRAASWPALPSTSGRSTPSEIEVCSAIFRRCQFKQKNPHLQKKGWGPFFPASELATRHYTKVLSFHILAHSFAHSKMLTPLLSSASALFAQNTRGVGYLFQAKSLSLPFVAQPILAVRPCPRSLIIVPSH